MPRGSLGQHPVQQAISQNGLVFKSTKVFLKGNFLFSKKMIDVTILDIFCNKILFVLKFRENLVSCLSNIHSFILHDCNQIPWAGSTEETVQITTLKIHGKKESIKVQTLDVPNLPYTKLIMKERINVRITSLPDMPECLAVWLSGRLSICRLIF